MAKYIYKYYFDVTFSDFYLLGHTREKRVSDIHLHWVINFCNYIHEIFTKKISDKWREKRWKRAEKVW